MEDKKEKVIRKCYDKGCIRFDRNCKNNCNWWVNIESCQHIPNIVTIVSVFKSRGIGISYFSCLKCGRENIEIEHGNYCSFCGEPIRGETTRCSIELPTKQDLKKKKVREEAKCIRVDCGHYDSTILNQCKAHIEIGSCAARSTKQIEEKCHKEVCTYYSTIYLNYCKKYKHVCGCGQENKVKDDEVKKIKCTKILCPYYNNNLDGCNKYTRLEGCAGWTELQRADIEFEVGDIVTSTENTRHEWEVIKINKVSVDVESQTSHIVFTNIDPSILRKKETEVKSDRLNKIDSIITWLSSIKVLEQFK